LAIEVFQNIHEIVTVHRFKVKDKEGIEGLKFPKLPEKNKNPGSHN